MHKPYTTSQIWTTLYHPEPLLAIAIGYPRMHGQEYTHGHLTKTENAQNYLNQRFLIAIYFKFI